MDNLIDFDCDLAQEPKKSHPEVKATSVSPLIETVLKQELKEETTAKATHQEVPPPSAESLIATFTGQLAELLSRQQPLATPSPKTKLTTFWDHDPEAWIIVALNQLSSNKVIEEKDKWEHFISAFSENATKQLRDVIIQPFEPYKGMFNYLVNQIRQRMTASPNARLNQILNNTDLGDLKPSEKLLHYRTLQSCDLREQVSDIIIRNRWLQSLNDPTLQHAVITHAASGYKTIDQLAQFADEFADFSKPLLSKVTPEQDILVEAISERRKGAQRRDENNSHWHQSSEQEHREPKSYTGIRRSHSQSQARKSNSTWTCFYHFKYGEKARSCEPNCTFNSKNGKGLRK